MTPSATAGSPPSATLALERGGVLPDVTVAYETWGTLSPSGDNAVLVEHALTGDSHVVGDSGPGHAVARLVGRADRPGAPARHRPAVRRREQRARRLPGHDRAGIRRPGRAAVGRPVPVHHRPRPGRRRGRARRRARHRGAGTACSVGRWAACGCSSGWRATPTASSVPSCSPRTAVRHRRPDGVVPAAAARHPVRPGLPRWRLLRPRRVAGHRHGHRAADRAHDLPARGRARRPVRPAGPGSARTRSAAAGATTSRATSTTTPAKLARRFDPNSYVVLTEAMNSHDVGRGRGGARGRPGRVRRLAARRRASTPTGSTRCACPRRSRPPHEGSVLSVIDSRHGHDGFLIETEQVGRRHRTARWATG